MHYGKYGLKKIVAIQDMEKEFSYIRKHYYTDLLKLFVVKDIDDYEDYKIDLYFTLNSLNIIKETNKTPSLKYLRNELLKCTKEYLNENVKLAINWYNKRIDNLFKNTEKENNIKKINFTNFDQQNFIQFIATYSKWLTKNLCLYSSHDISLGEVNRKINKLLHWNEVYEYRKKRAKEAFEDGFAELFSGLCKDENIYINRGKQYNLSCDSLFNNHISDLGSVFVELFDRVYSNKYNEKSEKQKIIREMQEMFNFVKMIGHTNHKKIMTDGEIRDSFLTSYSPDILLPMTEAEAIIYDRFCTCLLCYEFVAKAFKAIKVD